MTLFLAIANLHLTVVPFFLRIAVTVIEFLLCFLRYPELFCGFIMFYFVVVHILLNTVLNSCEMDFILFYFDIYYHVVES